MKLIILLMIINISPLFAMGKKPLVDARLQLAEQLKLADKVTGLEQKIDKMNMDVESQASAVAGVNNKIQRVSSEIKSGRDTITNNDSKLMEHYIEANKELSTRMIGLESENKSLYRYIIYIFATLLLKAYTIIFFVIKLMLKARDKDDEEQNKMLHKALNKKECL